MSLIGISNKSSTKDLIVSVLSQEWPLTAKQIFARISKQRQVSYQAVHKLLKELLSEKVLSKQNNAYSLSAEWIKKIETESAGLALGLKQRLPKVDLNTTRLEFETHWDFIYFMLWAMHSYFFDPKKTRKATCLVNHYFHYFPYCMSKKEYEALLIALNNFDKIMVSSGDTAIDQWLAKGYRKIARWKTGTKGKFSLPHDIMVEGETVINVYFAPKLNKKLDDLFAKAKTINEVDMEEFRQVFFKEKHKVTLFINRDEKIANQLIKKAKEYYKEAKK